MDSVDRRQAEARSAVRADSQDRAASSEHAPALSAVSVTEVSRWRIPHVGGPASETVSEVALEADSTAVEDFTVAVVDGKAGSRKLATTDMEK